MDIPETDLLSAMDFSRIKETSDGDTEFERELFGVFIEDCEERLQRLDSALLARHPGEIQREAHTIKGAAANVGTTRLQDIAMHLEALSDGTTAEGQALVAQLVEEFARVKASILTYLEGI
jgi:HPt (histidine-containing phosphotransfer) domain-containing protein